MFKNLSRYQRFLSKVYSLVQPYGRRRLGIVFMVILAQALFQIIGVTSIFPFLALAADPAYFRESRLGAIVLHWLPTLSDVQLLLLAGLFAICTLLFSNLLMLGGEVIRTRYSQGFAHWLRMRLLRQIVSNPYSYFLHRNTGELMKKASADVGVFVSGVLSPLLESSVRLITATLLLLTLLFINPTLAVSAALGFAVFYVSIFRILRWRRARTSNLLKEANRGSFKEMQQLLNGIKPVKVHGIEELLLNKYGQHSFTQASLHKWFPIYNNSPRYLIEPLAFGGIVIFVMFLAGQGRDFTSQIPILGVMALAGYRLIPNFQLLYAALSGITLMMHSLEEVYEEFHLGDAGDGQRVSRVLNHVREGIDWKHRILLDNISFTYTGTRQPVISQLTLPIEKNKFIAIIGETGSGKSTLVDILLGLHWPQEGQILVDDEVLTFERLRKWRAGIGYVPQEIFLRDDTVAANIAFGIQPEAVDMDQVRRVAEVAQIRTFIEEELADGFNNQVGERGVRLSGGQRQRIGLARALYHKPSLLILDEATSALDTSTEAALMAAIESLYGNITLVVIAHRLTTVQRADQIFRLRGGSILDAGTFEELGLKA